MPPYSDKFSFFYFFKKGMFWPVQTFDTNLEFWHFVCPNLFFGHFFKFGKQKVVFKLSKIIEIKLTPASTFCQNFIFHLFQKRYVLAGTNFWRKSRVLIFCLYLQYISYFKPPPKRFDIRSDVKFQNFPKLQTSFYPLFRTIQSMGPRKKSVSDHPLHLIFRFRTKKKLRFVCFRKVVF